MDYISDAFLNYQSNKMELMVTKNIAVKLFYHHKQVFLEGVLLCGITNMVVGASGLTAGDISDFTQY